MDVEQFDLVVLGGGNAVTIAIEAGKRGVKTAVIEESDLGGACPNRGCIPSKLLLGYADAAHAVREAGRFHVEATLGAIDGDAILRDTWAATRPTDGKIEGALNENVTLLRGRGRFVGERTLAVGDRRIRGERVVIGTGSRPRRPDIPGVADTPYWTSRHVFEMETLPRSIVIVGGGYIGCELAHFFNGVGVETTLVHRSDILLRAEDEAIRAVFREGFTAHVPTRLETQVTGVSHDGATFSIDLEGPGGERNTLQAEALLFAIGRVPNADRIGAETAGIALDERGFVQVDEHLRTSADGVYALGDVNGRYMFTHAAAFEARYLAQVLLDGRDDPLPTPPMPHAVFTAPEVAGVGATEQELRDAGTEYVTAALPFTSAAKGRAVKEQHGLCKFLLGPDGTILGCHVVGHQASVLVHQVIPVLQWRPHISSLTEMIHIHPSLSEVVRNTARKAAALVGAW